MVHPVAFLNKPKKNLSCLPNAGAHARDPRIWRDGKGKHPLEDGGCGCPQVRAGHNSAECCPPRGVAASHGWNPA